MQWYFILIPIIITLGILIVSNSNKRIVLDIDTKENTIPTILGLSLPTIITLLIVLFMTMVFKSCRYDDTEYLSYYYTKIRHTDEWNEYIHRTCTESVKVGEDKDGNSIYEEREYDCSYVEDHPERWILYDNCNSEIYVSQEEFEKIRKLWNVPMIFVDMHRFYHTKDGDAQDYVWDNNRNTIVTYTSTHHYENKIKNSQTQFKNREISDDEAKELGLYQYPQIDKNTNEINPIIGYKRFISKKDVKSLQYINAIYGKEKQFKNFLLIYKNCLSSIAEDQRCYWQGGNKNELVTCVGIDGKTNKVQWAYCFSWMDDATLEISCRNYIMSMNKFRVGEYTQWIEKNIKLWKRKEFKDFDYIDDGLSSDNILTIFWTVLIFNVLFFSINGLIMYSCIKENKNTASKFYL